MTGLISSPFAPAKVAFSSIVLKTKGDRDSRNRFFFKRSNNANPQTWELSLVGDWDSWSNLGSSQTRTHGAAHEFTSFTGASSGTLTYDVKGNMLTRPASLQSPALTLTWDFDNRMQGADTDGTPASLEVTFEYDAVGRRVARSGPEGNVVYVHSGQQVVADYTRGSAAGMTPLFRYVWGSYIDEPILRQTGSTTLLYYHHNQQFSTVALTNSSGLVASRYAYTAYGEQTLLDFTGAAQDFSTYAIRHTYTGREWDNDLKLHYFRARWYDAVAGRFIGRDPLGFVDGMSLYRGYFVLEGLDPSGLKSRDRRRDRRVAARRNWRRGFNGSYFDDRGIEILDHWLSGSGKPLYRYDGIWGEYMTANELLRSRIKIFLDADCSERQKSGNVDMQFHAEIENGFSTGYEMLHGTNKAKGDFQMKGVATVSYNAVGEKTIQYTISYRWNDIIDPNKKHWEDVFLSWTLEWFYEPKDYDIHITWTEESQCVVACNDPYNPLKEGYPFTKEKIQFVNKFRPEGGVIEFYNGNEEWWK